MKWPRRVLMGLALLGAFGLVAIGGLLTSLSFERSSEIELPALTGQFAVGRAIYDWRDDTNVDPVAPNPGTKREVLAWIWYPAGAGPSATTDDYLPAATRAAAGPAPFPFRFVYRDASKVRPHSMRNADMPTRRLFPVVIMRGGAAAEVSGYATLAEDLASHGYVVVGIDAPYRTGIVVFPDRRVIRRTDENDLELYSDADRPRIAVKLMAAWNSDIAFALDRLAQLNASDASGRFTGRFDMTRVGVFGHSFGGAQAAQFCHDDDRCKAAIDIDGRLFGSVIREGMQKPFMFLFSRRARADGVSPDPDTRQVLADVQSLYDRLPSTTRQWLFIRGANHFTYSDHGVVLSGLLQRSLRMVGVLEIDGRRQLAVTTYSVHTFFDAHLKDRRALPLKLSSPLYPEIERVD